MSAAGDIVAHIDQPCFGIGFALEHLEATFASAIDISGLPTDETGRQLALANLCHEMPSKENRW
jgi:hypothetical protein